MARNLYRNVGEQSFDNLFTGITPPADVFTVTLRRLAVAATYPKGTILARSDDDGLLVILGTAADEGEALVADCILAEETAIGTAAEVTAIAFRAGCFNPEALTVKSAYIITDTDKDELRQRNIVFKDMME